MIELPEPQKKEHRMLLLALKDVALGRMDMDEFDGICYKWTVEYAWNEYVYTPLPVAPLAVREWRDMSPKQKKVLDEPSKAYFLNILKGYLKYYGSIDSANRAKLAWLYKMRVYFEKHKDSRVGLVIERIQDFESKGCRLQRVAGTKY